jgi:hypothetical protein
MKNVTFPLALQDSGAAVKALHEALLHIARQSAIADYTALLQEPGFLRQWDIEYQTSSYGAATQTAVRLFQEKDMGIRPTGIVDETTAAAINNLLTSRGPTITGGQPGGQPAATNIPLQVSGTIYDQWIEPMADTPVMIFDKDMRREHLLAEGKTDAQGAYTISYSKEQLTRQDKGGANLIVRVYGNDGDPVFTSSVYYNAVTQLQMDVNLGPRPYQGPSQFVSTLKQVRELTGQMAIAELTENSKVHDLTFLMNKTGIAANILVQLVASFRFEKWTGLGAEAYYGILSGTNAFSASALPADLDSTIEQAYINFWSIAVADMITDLQQAADNNLVTYRLLAEQDRITAELQKLQTAPPQESGSTQTLPPVYANIQTAGLNATQQQTFLSLYNTSAVDSSFWTTLAAEPGFQGQAGAAAVSKLQAVFQVADWTGNNTALTAYIIQTYSVSSVSGLSSLVSQTSADWVTAIEASGTVPTPASGTASTTTADVQSIANSLAAGIEELYPTAVFADRFSRNTTLITSNKPYIAGILQASDFNLLTSPAMSYLTAYIAKNPLPQGAAQDTVAGQLMTMQRVYKVTQSADTALSLMGSNIQSARQIYAMGQASFTSQFQDQLGGADAAGAIFNQAATIHEGATYLTGQLVARLNNPSGNFMTNYTDQLTKSSLNTNFPDLANLFGMGTSYCECTDCSSWLSIPAYLADLLDFLYLRQTVTGSKQANARAVLLADGRRPDIADIDLDCENANVELPFIDIVNELLEDYIIPPVACFKISVENVDYAELWVKDFLSPGKITWYLYELITSLAKRTKNPICNISLLTMKATLSAFYITDDFNFPLRTGTTWEYVNLRQVVIRDEFITLKLYLVSDEGRDGNAELTYLPPADGAVNLLCTAVNWTPKEINAPTTNPGNSPVIDPAKGPTGGGTQDKNIYSFTLIVQEIHQTHLTTDVINTNPEYINTNVYNCLSDPLDASGLNLWKLYPTQIPMSLPFDLYFSESNVYLQEMKMKRYTLINTFRSEETNAGGYSVSIMAIARAYLGMSVAEEGVIFTSQATLPMQTLFWGPLASQTNVKVDLFLTASGLSFTQLQTLLTLSYINPGGESIILVKEVLVGGVPMADCDTSDMLITAMDLSKFDSINRFIRLWNKLNALTPISMEELDACYMSTVMEAGGFTGAFEVNLYYFLQVMSAMSLTATQALALYQNIGVTGDDSLYQQLFQNRQISNPLVAAFHYPLAGTSLITDTHANPGAVAVILTASGITNADLTAIIDLNSEEYGLLNLDNLSFIYACGLLAGALSIPLSDLITFATLLGYNPIGWIGSTPPARLILPSDSAATPASTYAFITAFNTLQQAGFDVDGLNYVLTNQSDASPSLIPDGTAVTSGLGSFRSAIQTAITATTPVADPQGSLLKKWLADPDLSWNAGVATQTMTILSTAGSDTYSTQVQNNLRFLQLLQLQYTVPSATAWLSQMPAITLPVSGVGNIGYDQTQFYLFYYGTMSSTLLTYLQSVAAADAATQTALSALGQQSQGCPLSAVLLPGASLSSPPAWVATAASNVPAFSGGTGVLGFAGAMPGPVYTALLAQSPDPAYGCALSQLFLASQAITPPPTTYVQLAALPAIALPDTNAATLQYILKTPANQLPSNELSFSGAMSAADALGLLSLSTDTDYQAAICALFTTATAGQTVSAPLTALPAGWGLLPDITGLGSLSFVPAVTGSSPVPSALCFTGQMQAAVKTAYDGLSADPTWTANILSLYQNSQSAVVASTTIAALPAGLTAASFPLNGVSYTPGSGSTPGTLSYTGPMSDTTLDLLLQANTDPGWAAAATTLYQNAQASLVSSVQLTLPSGLTDASFSGIGGIASVTTGVTTVLSATGQMSPATQQKLLLLSGDAGFVSAIGYLFAQTSAIIPGAPPFITLPLADTNLSTAAFTPGAIVFYNGIPNPNCMDEFNLWQLNDDPGYQAAIQWIYSIPPPTAPAVHVGATLDALPSITLPSDIHIKWLAGELRFTGQMQHGEYIQLQQLSADAAYQEVLTTLYTDSQVTSIVTLTGTSLPTGVTTANLKSNQVTCQQGTGDFVLSFTGLMSAATKTALLALSGEAVYQTAIDKLYSQSQTTAITTTPLTALPPITIPAGSSFSYQNGVLYYTGSLPISTATLTPLSTAPEYQAVLANIAGVTAIPNSGTYMIFAPAPLTTFPQDGFTLAAGSIEYTGGTIGFTNIMPFADYLALLAFSTDASYRAVVNDLYVRSQSSSTTIQSQASLSLPPLPVPAIYANQLSYATATNMLTLLGYMGISDFMALASYSSNLAWLQALEALAIAVNGAGADNFEPVPFPSLYENLWPETSGVLAPPAAATLYEYFLDKLSVVYQPIKEAEGLQSAIAAAFGVSLAVGGVLVDGLPAMFASMTDPVFAGNTKAINPDPSQCPQALWYMKLARMTYLVSQFNLAATDTQWLLTNGSSVGAIDFTAYPSVSSPLSFSGWSAINNLCTFQRTYPPVQVTDPANVQSTMPVSVYTVLSNILVLSGGPGLPVSQLVLLTGWSESELLYLLNIGQPNLPNLALNPLGLTDTNNPAMGSLPELRNTDILMRLSACFTTAAQMKVIPSRCVTWTTDPLTSTIASDIKQALKSQYPDMSSWSSVITPLTNTLRMARRDALVAYLLSNAVTNVWGDFPVFSDEFAIYGNFLIDVEMGACQPTTRTIQAYCSIQLFVQRCFLSLEPSILPDISKDEFWGTWASIGTFETWYEARYTFLFPENLVLPQTLPSQSTLFQDLQNDLTQGSVTTDVVETAFENYIEGLDEIALLQVCGTWYDDATGNVYVFACTYTGNPPDYYFRIFDGSALAWGPWESITTDISGGQIVPVLQNGRLFLYWPVFTQASDDNTVSQPVPAQGGNTSSQPPTKYWTIAMAFSEYKNGQWSGKKVSQDVISTHPITVSSGTPQVYPDTSNFVFIPLDIPPKDSDALTATQQNLVINNTMAIACYQYWPPQQKVNITVSFTAGLLEFPFTLPVTYQINIYPFTQTFKANDLLNALKGTFTSAGITLNWNSLSNNVTLPLDKTKIATALNGYGVQCVGSWSADGWDFNSSGSPLTFDIKKIDFLTSVAGSDVLQIVDGAGSGWNTFELDPLRGFPTPVKLSSLIADYTGTISTVWWGSTTFDYNLDQGTTPLTTSNLSTKILKPSGSLTFINLLPFQMGLWAKYNTVSTNKLDLSKLGILMPSFYQGKSRSFLVTQAMKLFGHNYCTYLEAAVAFKKLGGSGTQLTQFKNTISHSNMTSGPYYQFSNFYHPFAHYFIRIVAQDGAAGVITRAIQLTGDPNYGGLSEVKSNPIHKAGYSDFSFKNAYGPQTGSIKNILNYPYKDGYPVEQMDFDLGTAYSQYNWELFFHSVLLSGLLLSQNQQFAAADACLKLIFNPTDLSGQKNVQKYWVTKPFYEETTAATTIQDLITLYSADPTSSAVAGFNQQVINWKLDPYDPHLLALTRKTPYMYCTFMKYLDNLIAWANSNYQQYTMETVNFAIELYMLALEMLGTKPEVIPPVEATPICTYNQLESNLDMQIAADGEGYLSDPVVQLENLLPVSGSGSGGYHINVPILKGLYFCIPPNEVLLGYWDTVETQLNKIRNCMNIQGQFQPLSPFPSIPGLNNMDGAGTGDFGGVVPYYRFSVMIQKAIDLCNEVKSFGASLLSALEKRDAEGLALLRASQEIAVQQAIDQIKQMQITDAQFGLQNLQNYQQLINDKITYYSGLIQQGLIPLEQQALALNQFSLAMQGPTTAASIIAKAMSLTPAIQVGSAGFGGSPTVTVTMGGEQMGGSADAFVQFMSFLSTFADKSAALANTNATYSRRLTEWTFQLQQANDELAQVNTQIQAAQNKIAMATQDEKNQQLLIQNAEDVETFLTNKYTNQQLYAWMVSQLSNTYFQVYQVAYQHAKKTEICFGFELGITGTSYINYGYWDTLHKGLLSGEGLMSSLRQMESDYLTYNLREYELTRQISLAQFDPLALLQLKTNNTCFINIPEELFDLDYPGHYFRRIKHIAVTLPGVVGPYTPVCLKMTLLSNSVRIDSTAGTPANYPRRVDPKGNPISDSRFLDNVAGMQYIATSTGVNDNGLFELNLNDERYLPFERAGAISTWQLEFASVYPQFDPGTLTDLIIHFNYTARDGGALLQQVATGSVQSKLASVVTSPDLVLMRGFSARRDFPTQWYKFLNPQPGDAQQLTMDITRRFPFFTNGLTIKISQVTILADVPAASQASGTAGAQFNELCLSGTKLSNALLSFSPDPEAATSYNEIGSSMYSSVKCKDTAGIWTITNGTGQGPAPVAITAGEMNDLWVIFYYSLVNNS